MGGSSVRAKEGLGVKSKNAVSFSAKVLLVRADRMKVEDPPRASSLRLPVRYERNLAAASSAAPPLPFSALAIVRSESW